MFRSSDPNLCNSWLAISSVIYSSPSHSKWSRWYILVDKREKVALDALQILRATSKRTKFKVIPLALSFWKQPGLSLFLFSGIVFWTVARASFGTKPQLFHNLGKSDSAKGDIVNLYGVPFDILSSETCFFPPVILCSVIKKTHTRVKISSSRGRVISFKRRGRGARLRLLCGGMDGARGV